MTRLRERHYDRNAVISLLTDLRANLAANTSPDEWENSSLDGFLEALGGWLGDSEGYYRNLGRDVPENPWEVIWHALSAAPSYE